MSSQLSLFVFTLLLLAQTLSVAMAADPPAKELSLEETQALLTSRLSEQWKVGVDQIQVSEAEEQIWPDASLGCAGKRRLMGRSPVPGYRFVLVLGDERLTFHADKHGIIQRCDASGKPLGPIAD